MSGKQSDERPWSIIETELLRQLRGATASMRALQKHYFATRDRQVLGEARRAESIVDNCLRRLDELDAAMTERGL